MDERNFSLSLCLSPELLSHALENCPRPPGCRSNIKPRYQVDVGVMQGRHYHQHQTQLHWFESLGTPTLDMVLMQLRIFTPEGQLSKPVVPEPYNCQHAAARLQLDASKS